jgi:hypothetical protein
MRGWDGKYRITTILRCPDASKAIKNLNPPETPRYRSNIVWPKDGSFDVVEDRDVISAGGTVERGFYGCPEVKGGIDSGS